MKMAITGGASAASAQSSGHLESVPDGKGPAKVQSIEFANYPVVSHSDRRRLSGLGVLCLVRETERMIRLLKQGGRGGGGAKKSKSLTKDYGRVAAAAAKTID